VKVAIVGSRLFTGPVAYDWIIDAVRASGFEVEELVSGGADGIDSAAEQWANIHHLPKKIFLPLWKRNGRQAGFIRNHQIVEYADAVIAIWDMKSRGTRSTIELTIAAGKPIKVFAPGLPSDDEGLLEVEDINEILSD